MYNVRTGIFETRLLTFDLAQFENIRFNQKVCTLSPPPIMLVKKGFLFLRYTHIHFLFTPFCCRCDYNSTCVNLDAVWIPTSTQALTCTLDALKTARLMKLTENLSSITLMDKGVYNTDGLINLSKPHIDFQVYKPLHETCFTELILDWTSIKQVMDKSDRSTNIDEESLFPPKLKYLRGITIVYVPTSPGIQQLEVMLQKLPRSLETLEIHLLENKVTCPSPHYLSMKEMLSNLTSLSIECRWGSDQFFQGITHFPSRLQKLRYITSHLDPGCLPEGLLFLNVRVKEIRSNRTFPMSLRSMKGSFPASAISLLPDTLQHLKVRDSSDKHDTQVILTFPRCLHVLIIDDLYTRIQPSALVHLRFLHTLRIRSMMTEKVPLQLPEGITNMHMAVSYTPVLPDSLRNITIMFRAENDISPVSFLRPIINRLPPALESLKIRSIFAMYRLRTALPSTLRKLVLDGGYCGKLPDLPYGIETLFFSNVMYTEKIPHLPETLHSVTFPHVIRAIRECTEVHKKESVARSLFTNIPRSWNHVKHEYMPLTVWNELQGKCYTVDRHKRKREDFS